MSRQSLLAYFCFFVALVSPPLNAELQDTAIGDTEGVCFRILADRNAPNGGPDTDRDTDWLERVWKKFTPEQEQPLANSDQDEDGILSMLSDLYRETVNSVQRYFNDDDLLTAGKDGSSPPIGDLDSNAAQLRRKLIGLMNNPVSRKALIKAAQERLYEIERRTQEKILKGELDPDVIVRGGGPHDSIHNNGLVGESVDLNILTIEERDEYAPNFRKKLFEGNSSNNPTTWGRRPIPRNGENLNYFPGCPIQVSDWSNERYFFSIDIADVALICRALSGHDILFNTFGAASKYNKADKTISVNLQIREGLVTSQTSLETRMFVNATGIGPEKLEEVLALSDEAKELREEGKLETGDEFQERIYAAEKPFSPFIDKEVAVIGGGNTSDNAVEWLLRAVPSLYYGRDKTSLGRVKTIYWFNPRFPDGLNEDNCKEYSENTRVRYCAIASAITSGQLVIIKDPRVTGVSTRDGRLLVNNEKGKSYMVDHVIAGVGREDRADLDVEPSFGSIFKQEDLQNLEADEASTDDAERSAITRIQELVSTRRLRLVTNTKRTLVSAVDPREFNEPDRGFKAVGYLPDYTNSQSGIRIVELLRDLTGLNTSMVDSLKLEAAVKIDDGFVKLIYAVKSRNSESANIFEQPVIQGQNPELYNLIVADRPPAANSFVRVPVMEGGKQIATTLRDEDGDIVPYIYIGPSAGIEFDEEELSGVEQNFVSFFLQAGPSYLSGAYVVDQLFGGDSRVYTYGDPADQAVQQAEVERRRVRSALNEYKPKIRFGYNESPAYSYYEETGSGFSLNISPIEIKNYNDSPPSKIFITLNSDSSNTVTGLLEFYGENESYLVYGNERSEVRIYKNGEIQLDSSNLRNSGTLKFKYTNIADFEFNKRLNFDNFNAEDVDPVDFNKVRASIDVSRGEGSDLPDSIVVELVTKNGGSNKVTKKRLYITNNFGPNKVFYEGADLRVEFNTEGTANVYFDKKVYTFNFPARPVATESRNFSNSNKSDGQKAEAISIETGDRFKGIADGSGKRAKVLFNLFSETMVDIAIELEGQDRQQLKFERIVGDENIYLNRNTGDRLNILSDYLLELTFAEDNTTYFLGRSGGLYSGPIDYVRPNGPRFRPNKLSLIPVTLPGNPPTDRIASVKFDEIPFFRPELEVDVPVDQDLPLVRVATTQVPQEGELKEVFSLGRDAVIIKNNRLNYERVYVNEALSSLVQDTVFLNGVAFPKNTPLSRASGANIGLQIEDYDAEKDVLYVTYRFAGSEERLELKRYTRDSESLQYRSNDDGSTSDVRLILQPNEEILIDAKAIGDDSFRQAIFSVARPEFVSDEL